MSLGLNLERGAIRLHCSNALTAQRRLGFKSSFYMMNQTVILLKFPDGCIIRISHLCKKKKKEKKYCFVFGQKMQKCERSIF